MYVSVSVQLLPGKMPLFLACLAALGFLGLGVSSGG